MKLLRLAVLMVVCACERRDLSACVPGRAVPCACSDGRTGAQTCRDDRVFAPCVCTPPRGADEKPEPPRAPDLAVAPAHGAARAALPHVPVSRPADSGIAETRHGVIDRDQVNAALAAQDRSFRMCYGRSLAEQPGLAGLLEVDFTVDLAARVTRVATRGLISAPEVGACVAQIVRATTFPAAQGAPVALAYTLQFP